MFVVELQARSLQRAHLLDFLGRRDEVVAVIHDDDLAFVAVFSECGFDGGLWYPDFVRLFVEADDIVNHFIHNRSEAQSPLKVLSVLGMESRYHGYVLFGSYLSCECTGGEGAVGMDDAKLLGMEMVEELIVKIGHTKSIGFAHGDRYGNISLELVFSGLEYFLGMGGIGGNDTDLFPLLSQPIGIVLHGECDAVHDGREIIVEESYHNYNLMAYCV